MGGNGSHDAERSKVASIADAQRSGLGGRIISTDPRPVVSFHVLSDGSGNFVPAFGHDPKLHPAEAELLAIKAMLRFVLRQ